MSASSIRRTLPAATALVLTALAAAWPFARLIETGRNTLDNQGRWLSMKTVLENGVNAAFAFVDGQQGLAGGRLNLSAWHGFQEVFYRERLRLGEVRFDFGIAPNSYVCFLFNKVSGPFSGIRLSRHPVLGSAFFRLALEATRFLAAAFLLVFPWHRATSCNVVYPSFISNRLW